MLTTATLFSDGIAMSAHNRLIAFMLVSTLLFLVSPGYAQRWVEDAFDDFADGTLDASGQNLYVSRDGKIRTINRFDLNDDGYLDLIFNCTHDTYQMLPATLARLTREGRSQSHDIAVEGSQRVALGDLNRDGFTDAVFCPNRIGVHHDRRHVSIAWGGKDGWPPQRINGVLPMNAAVDVEIVDLNRDGWPDIAVLGAERWRVDQPPGGVIRIFRGGEDGFSVVDRQDIGVTAAIAFAAADFDNDGARDLAVLRGDGKVTTVWATRSNAVEVDYARSEVVLPQHRTVCLTAADADADGRADLVVGTDQPTLFLVTAMRGRAWGKPQALPAFAASHVAVGDLDGDEHPDLALTQFGAARAAGGEQAGTGETAEDVVRVLWGEGGEFHRDRSTSLPAKYAVATAIGDLNSDGHADLAVAVHQSAAEFNGESMALLGDGKRHFTRAAQGFKTSGTTDVAIAPAEKDLPARAIFCNSIGGRVDEGVPLHVFWGGKHGFDAKRVWTIPFHSGYEASAADLNADGFVDLIALNSGHAGDSAGADPTLGANIFWGGRDGFDLLLDTRTVLHEHFLGTSGVADLNRDGYLDLVLEPFAPKKPGGKDMLFVYYGGKDGFDKARRAAFESDGYSQEHLIADFNADGWLDIAVTTRKLHCVRIFWNGPAGFDPKREQRLKMSSPLGVDAADFNGDGHLDMLVGSYDDPIAGYRDMGNLIFWGSRHGFRHWNSQWLPGFSPLGRTVADFDGDGHLDIFSPQHSGELTREDLACHIYWGSESGFATRRRTTLFSDSVNDSMAGDFNSDGRIDLAVNSHTRHGDHRTMSRVFYNDGNRFQNPKIQKLPSNGPHLMWAADVGHIADRKYRQYYESSVFAWNAAKKSGELSVEADVPNNTALVFQVRSTAQRGELARTAWRAVTSNRFSVEPEDRFLQYRAVFQSHNGDRYPIVDRVVISLR